MAHDDNKQDGSNDIDADWKAANAQKCREELGVIYRKQNMS